MPRAELERSVLETWPFDLFVQRPADPKLSLPLLALWGPGGMKKSEFAEALSRLSVRQLMTLMVAGQLLGSAVLGLEAVTTDLPLTPLALGACDRHFSSLARWSLGPGALDLGGSTGRYEPWDADERYCQEVCCPEAGPRRELAPGCPVVCALDTMRRFAAFPEEPV